MPSTSPPTSDFSDDTFTTYDRNAPTKAHGKRARRQEQHYLDFRERPVISAEEAFQLLGIDRSTGYKAIREGTFPIPILRVGRLIRIPTAGLLRLFQLRQSGPDDGQEAE